jgi:2-methylcitrate dehydratase PrpD
VIHPTIDGCIQLRREGRIVPGDIAAVRLEVAPLVLDLCNKKAISKGLEGKFSIYHAAAIGLVRGKAGLGEFTDETVNDPDVRRVRERVTATANPAVAEDAAHIEVELAGGERLRKRVEHALGNLARPMTDRELEEKFRDQAARVLPAARVESLIGLCWKIGELHDLRKLIEGTLPDA